MIGFAFLTFVKHPAIASGFVPPPSGGNRGTDSKLKVHKTYTIILREPVIVILNNFGSLIH
jgi:hypothetical protein